MPSGVSSSSSSLPMSPAALAQRHRMVRNARQTVDCDFNEVGRLRFRSSEEVSGGAGNSTQFEDVRCDSPVTARQGSAVNCFTGPTAAVGESIDGTLNNNQITGGAEGFTGSGGSILSRRRCGKTPKDLHPVHNQRIQLAEQVEECPSSGDEGVVSPRKRIKMDYHHHHHHSNASGVSKCFNKDTTCSTF